jgi:hypothetical protein
MLPLVESYNSIDALCDKPPVTPATPLDSMKFFLDGLHIGLLLSGSIENVDGPTRNRWIQYHENVLQHAILAPDYDLLDEKVVHLEGLIDQVHEKTKEVAKNHSPSDRPWPETIWKIIWSRMKLLNWIRSEITQHRSHDDFQKYKARKVADKPDVNQEGLRRRKGKSIKRPAR